MPPKAQWGPEQKNALNHGFREFHWNPLETDGKTINALISSVPEIKQVLQPFFSQAQGGLKSTNNQLHTHFKTAGGEFMTSQAREGIRTSTAERGASSVERGV